MTQSISTPTPVAQTIAPPDIHERPIAPPVYEKVKLTTEQAANLLIKGKIGDRHLDGTTKILYEFFSVANSQHYPYHSPGEFNANQKDQTRRAIQSWTDLANVEFEELHYNPTHEEAQVLMGKRGHNDHRLIFGQTPNLPDSAGHDPGYGGRHSSQARFGFSTIDADFGHESYKRSQLASVIGNALGLGGPLQINTRSYIDNTGKTVPGDSAFHTKDTRDYTMMSPHAGKNSVISKHLTPSKYGPDHEMRREENMPAAPLLHDIVAIQKVYGANMKTRNTDTTYGFNSNTDRDFLSLNTDKDKAIFCVWDGGGNDTLDFSGYAQDQKINLYERSFSDVGGMKSNVSIARGVTLENAVGGAGDDMLIGNHADNRLKGGIGADTLEGGNGADTFVYDRANESTPDKYDLITDFSSGTDKIDVSGMLKTSGVSGLNFVSSFTGKAGDTVLSYDPNNGRGSLAVDLTGNGQADFLIKTTGQIAPDDVLVSTPQHAPTPEPMPAVSPPTALIPQQADRLPSQGSQRIQFGASQSIVDTPATENKNVAHVTVANIAQGPTDKIRSPVPATHTPVTIVSVKYGNWNHYIDMPKTAEDNDLVIINSTAKASTKVICPTTAGKQFLDIEYGQKRVFKYAADTKTWEPQVAGEASHWIGSKIMLGTSHAVVDLDRGNWRPEARLPSDGKDGDILRLYSDAPLPIDIKTPDGDDTTVWRLTRGDIIDFQYSAKSGAWTMLRPANQFHRPQTLADGVLAPIMSWRTYIEVTDDDWKESITLPANSAREGVQVIVKTTADKSFKINTGLASHTIGPKETVTFIVDKHGQWVRQLESGDVHDYAVYRSKLGYFKEDGVWRSWS